MDAVSIFYRTLSGASFTLLGLWFALVQFAHGGWRTKPSRHRATLHIGLHFFLPGGMGLFALLAGPTDGGLIWRVTFIVGSGIGLLETVSYLRPRARPIGLILRALAIVDVPLFVVAIAAAFLPVKALAITPLQIEGLVTGLLLISGMYSVWLAFAERDGSAEIPEGGAAA